MRQLSIHCKKENVKKANRLQPDGFDKGKRLKLLKRIMRIEVWNIQVLREKVGEIINKFESRSLYIVALSETYFLNGKIIVIH